MEPEGSFPHSQQPATCPYPKPDQSSPCPLIPLLEDQFLKLSFHRRLGVSSGLFLSATANNKINERITDCIQIMSKIQMFQYSLVSSVLYPHRLSPTPPSVSQHTRKSWDKQPTNSITKYSLRCEVSNHSYQSLLYIFFWVFPRRQIVVGRRFGTLYQFHLQRLGVHCTPSL